ncbi:hypothetical protein IFR04_013814 [Cadophora malorum]|uniref:Uncharacterized protein n=1 Tax=Cadophora malorum TaxID=108018 RepID=A0A8H7W0Y7_9HELO|nr:hypothetical protein IFR04_013814 [Cadophora malorum]
MARNPSLQFVWPKDGPKGRGHRGFWGRLNNIKSGQGPDIFLQRRGSREPIKPDQWQNWDSYRFFDAHIEEMTYPASRKYERYDPHDRTYKKWSIPEDWNGLGASGLGIRAHADGLPRFTQNEWVEMQKLRRRGRQINPAEMGDEWTNHGPKRWDVEHNDFWSNAHRQAENVRQGLPRWGGANPMMRANLPYRDYLVPWMNWEGIY